MSTAIEMYPKCKKPAWIKKNAWCFCYGEGDTKLQIDYVGTNAAFLIDEDKFAHGWESFTKLYQNRE